MRFCLKQAKIICKWGKQNNSVENKIILLTPLADYFDLFFSEKKLEQIGAVVEQKRQLMASEHQWCTALWNEAKSSLFVLMFFFM